MYESEAVASSLDELHRASKKFGTFNSKHEGFAVLLEEVDELWAEIKRKPSVERDADLRKEAIQVAAMALRFLVDCVPSPAKPN